MKTTQTPGGGAIKASQTSQNGHLGGPGSESGGASSAWPGTGLARRLAVTGERANVTIVADPSVSSPIVVGPHAAEIQGETLLVRGDRSPARGQARNTDEVSVLVHPSTVLDVQLAVGDVSVIGVTAPIRVRMSVGHLAVEGFAAPIDLRVDAGSITARGRLDHGTSSIAAESGRVQLALSTGSSVQITASTDCGRLVLPGGVRVGGLPYLPEAGRTPFRSRGSLALDGDRAVIVGEGAATLTLRTREGRMEVSAPE